MFRKRAIDYHTIISTIPFFVFELKVSFCYPLQCRYIRYQSVFSRIKPVDFVVRPEVYMTVKELTHFVSLIWFSNWSSTIRGLLSGLEEIRQLIPASIPFVKIIRLKLLCTMTLNNFNVECKLLTKFHVLFDFTTRLGRIEIVIWN